MAYFRKKVEANINSTTWTTRLPVTVILGNCQKLGLQANHVQKSFVTHFYHNDNGLSQLDIIPRKRYHCGGILAIRQLPCVSQFIKMPSYQNRNSHYKDKTVSRLSYFYTGNLISGKTVFILRQGYAVNGRGYTVDLFEAINFIYHKANSMVATGSWIWQLALVYIEADGQIYLRADPLCGWW